VQASHERGGARCSWGARVEQADVEERGCARVAQRRQQEGQQRAHFVVVCLQVEAARPPRLGPRTVVGPDGQREGYQAQGLAWHPGTRCMLDRVCQQGASVPEQTVGRPARERQGAYPGT